MIWNWPFYHHNNFCAAFQFYLSPLKVRKAFLNWDAAGLLCFSYVMYVKFQGSTEKQCFKSCFFFFFYLHQSFVPIHGKVCVATSFSGAGLKCRTYTPRLSCSSFQREPLSVRPECIRFSIGNAVLKILAWLKVYTDRSLNSPPCDDLPSSRGHLVLWWLT